MTRSVAPPPSAQQKSQPFLAKELASFIRQQQPSEPNARSRLFAWADRAGQTVVVKAIAVVPQRQTELYAAA